jgi:hypothetical protein
VRAVLVVVIFLAACDPFAPHENQSRTVEGCSDAIAHLRACCPKFDSYVSCTYFANAVASPDLTKNQSRCLTRTPCAEIQRDVESGSRVCSFLPVTTHCR